MPNAIWVKPRRLIEPLHAIPLSKFFHVVGAEVFGGLWNEVFTANSENIAHASDDCRDQRWIAMNDLVNHQLVSALSRHRTAVEFRFNNNTQCHTFLRDLQGWANVFQREKNRKLKREVKSNPKANQSQLTGQTPKGEDDDFDGDPELVELARAIYRYQPRKHFDPVKTDRDIRPRLSPKFWINKLPSDVIGVTDVSVAATFFILDKSSGAPYKEEIHLDHDLFRDLEFKGSLWVRQPEKTLRGAFDWPEERTVDAWGKYWLQYQRVLWPELVAVAWRVIALKKIEAGHGAINMIASAVEDYIDQFHMKECSPLRVSENYLREIVSEIANQLHMKDTALSKKVVPAAKRNQAAAPRKPSVAASNRRNSDK